MTTNGFSLTEEERQRLFKVDFGERSCVPPRPAGSVPALGSEVPVNADPGARHRRHRGAARLDLAVVDFGEVFDER